MRKLILAQFISAVGDQLYMVSLLFLTLSIENEFQAVKTGLVSFFETLPYFTVGLFSGVLVDRFSSRNVMVLSDVARGLILLCVPLLQKFSLLNWMTLSAIGFLLSSFSTMFYPARDKLVGKLVEERELPKANALVQTSYQFALFLGGIVAPLILSFKESLILLLVLDGFTFILSALLILLIEESGESRRLKNFRNPLKEILDGIAYSFRNKLVRNILVLTALDNLFIMGPATVGANLYVKEFLNLGAKEFSLFNAFMSLGWFISAYITPKLMLRLGYLRTLILGVFMDGLTYLPFVFIYDFEKALLFIFIHGLFIPLITVSRTSIIQRYVSDRYMGRVFSLINLSVVGFMSLSSIITGILGELVSANYLFAYAGIGGALSGILGILLFRRKTFQPPS